MLNKTEFSQLAARLMRTPTAPFHEEGIKNEIRAIAGELKLPITEDPFGNLTIQRPGTGRPLALMAHMDHPAFQVLKFKNGLAQALFQGGVHENYLLPNSKVVLYPGGLQARITQRTKGKYCDLRVEDSPRDDQPPAFGVWDVVDFKFDGTRITGRVCDDLIGCATMLAVLNELKSRRSRQPVIALFTRAEEVGFFGALAVAKHKLLPADALVISLETSRELPPVEMGEGVIIRTGDRASIFSSKASRYLMEMAIGLRNETGLKYQRALMSGGTCEATAMQEFGYETAAVCIALGNYHNCGPAHTIKPEFVSVEDALWMAELLVEAALNMKDYDRITGRLPKRLNKLAVEAERKLRAGE